MTSRALFNSIDDCIKDVATRADTLLFEPTGGEKKDRPVLLGKVLSLVLLYEGAYRETPTALARLLTAKPERTKDDRKKSGSYFTPRPIVSFMVEATIGPLIDKPFKRIKSRERRIGIILDSRILDPCMGAGTFLIHAHDYLIQRLLALNRNTLRRGWPEAAARCIYGMDINPAAVELTTELLHLNILKWNLRDKIKEFVCSAGSDSPSQKSSSGKPVKPPTARVDVQGFGSI